MGFWGIELRSENFCTLKNIWRQYAGLDRSFAAGNGADFAIIGASLTWRQRKLN
jgi:hypothetical protein